MICFKQWETIYEDDFSAPEHEAELESDDSDFEFDGVRTKKVSKSRKKERERKVTRLDKLNLKIFNCLSAVCCQSIKRNNSSKTNSC